MKIPPPKSDTQDKIQDPPASGEQKNTEPGSENITPENKE
jgi:hypothetical protein